MIRNLIDVVWFTWCEFWVPIVLASSFVGILTMIVLGAQADAERWDAFKVEHACKITGKMRGETVVGTGIGSNGGIVTTVGSTGDKTGWTCNDGVTYWR